MLSFDFFRKGCGDSSPPHFAYDFSRKQEKCSSCYTLSTDQISLPLLLEILVNMCIENVC